MELAVPGRVHPWPQVSNAPKKQLTRARIASQQEGRNATCNLNTGDTHTPTLIDPSLPVKRAALRSDGTDAAGCAGHDEFAPFALQSDVLPAATGKARRCAGNLDSERD
jgi:hypothetical protein